MSQIAIADSSALISLINNDDSLHHKALGLRDVMNTGGIQLVIPSEVFAETINVFGKKSSNEVAVAAGAIMLSDEITIPAANRGILMDAIERLRGQKASVSYVDALVMVWADYYETPLIFGFDAVFAANGYQLPGKAG
jgi:predicted nucleic acid-binding protein